MQAGKERNFIFQLFLVLLLFLSMFSFFLDYKASDTNVSVEGTVTAAPEIDSILVATNSSSDTNKSFVIPGLETFYLKVNVSDEEGISDLNTVSFQCRQNQVYATYSGCSSEGDDCVNTNFSGSCTENNASVTWDGNDSDGVYSCAFTLPVRFKYSVSSSYGLVCDVNATDDSSGQDIENSGIYEVKKVGGITLDQVYDCNFSGSAGDENVVFVCSDNNGSTDNNNSGVTVLHKGNFDFDLSLFTKKFSSDLNYIPDTSFELYDTTNTNCGTGGDTSFIYASPFEKTLVRSSSEDLICFFVDIPAGTNDGNYSGTLVFRGFVD